jgi:hypothetical protein
MDRGTLTVLTPLVEGSMNFIMIWQELPDVGRSLLRDNFGHHFLYNEFPEQKQRFSRPEGDLDESQDGRLVIYDSRSTEIASSGQLLSLFC